MANLSKSNAPWWLDDVIDRVTEPEARRLKALRHDLIEDNAKLGGHPDGFLFGGGRWTLKQTRSWQRLTTIHQSLVEEAIDLKRAGQQLRDDRSRIRHSLIMLLDHATCDQDARDLLPDYLMHFLQEPEITHLSRKRPQAYCYEGKPFLMRDWEQTEEILSSHVVNHLIY